MSFLNEFANAFLYTWFLLGLPYLIMMASDSDLGDPLRESSRFDNVLEWGMAIFVFIIFPIIIAIGNASRGS